MKELPFEQAFKRLEEILERMNSSDITRIGNSSPFPRFSHVGERGKTRRRA